MRARSIPPTLLIFGSEILTAKTYLFTTWSRCLEDVTIATHLLLYKKWIMWFRLNKNILLYIFHIVLIDIFDKIKHTYFRHIHLCEFFEKAIDILQTKRKSPRQFFMYSLYGLFLFVAQVLKTFVKHSKQNKCIITSRYSSHKYPAWSMLSGNFLNNHQTAMSLMA